jgi:hypothetical protein
VGKGSSSVDQDMHWYMGTSETRGRLCICPARVEHVTSKQHTEAMIHKERRKLEEERKSLKKGKDHKEGE